MLATALLFVLELLAEPSTSTVWAHGEAATTPHASREQSRMESPRRCAEGIAVPAGREGRPSEHQLERVGQAERSTVQERGLRREPLSAQQRVVRDRDRQDP